MSIAEAQRFAAALAEDEALRTSVKPLVSGLGSFVAAARQHGYDFTLDEAKQLVRDKAAVHKLSEEELDAVAAGDMVSTHSVSLAVQANTGAVVVDAVIAGVVV